MSEKKIKKNIVAGIVHVYSSFNNTIITIADQSGNTIVWDSSGMQGFKGSKKATPYAAQKAAESAARKAFEHGVKTVDVLIKGPGVGKEQAILGIKSAGITINLIRDVTSYPFNGVRPRKKRRV